MRTSQAISVVMTRQEPENAQVWRNEIPSGLLELEKGRLIRRRKLLFHEEGVRIPAHLVRNADPSRSSRTYCSLSLKTPFFRRRVSSQFLAISASMADSITGFSLITPSHDETPKSIAGLLNSLNGIPTNCCTMAAWSPLLRDNRDAALLRISLTSSMDGDLRLERRRSDMVKMAWASSPSRSRGRVASLRVQSVARGQGSLVISTPFPYSTGAVSSILGRVPAGHLHIYIPASSYIEP
jgi:hypothetical protein